MSEQDQNRIVMEIEAEFPLWDTELIAQEYMLRTSPQRVLSDVSGDCPW